MNQARFSPNEKAEYITLYGVAPLNCMRWYDEKNPSCCIAVCFRCGRDISGKDAPKETDDTLYLMYNGELYTDSYVRDCGLSFLVTPCVELSKKDIAYSVYPNDTKNKSFPRTIQTYTDDPDNYFILEKDFLFDDRLYRKVSLDLPD